MEPWEPHSLLAGFGLMAPPGLSLDPYWHFLTLPQVGGVPSDNIASYVLRFDRPAVFDRFEEYVEWSTSGSEDDRGKDDRGKDDRGKDALSSPPADSDAHDKGGTGPVEGDEGEVLKIPRQYFTRTLNRADRYPREITGFSPPGIMDVIVSGLTGDWPSGPNWGQIFTDVLAVGAPRHPGVPECIPNPGVDETEMLSPDPRPEVIVAIIDTDIAFANERFRRPRSDTATPSLETRIAWYWDMDADCDPDHGLAIGREMFARRPAGVHGHRYLFIDELLADASSGGAVDEVALYARYQDFSYRSIRRRRPVRAKGHGTHILDVVAGAPPTGELADDTPIFAVQLPRLVVNETHGTFLSAYVQLALDRIEYMAQTWPGQGETRVIVNFSFGGSAGRHDGLSQLEVDFDRRIREGRLAGMCIAAGNSLESQSHARFTGAELQTERDLAVRIQPGDGSPNFLQIWLPPMDEATAVSALELEVRPPSGPPLQLNGTGAPMQAGTFWELADGPDMLARLYIQFDAWPPESGTRRLRIALGVRHTAQFHVVPGHGPGIADLAGDWMLKLSSPAIADEDEVTLWVERDDMLPGARTRARQSYFVRTDASTSLDPRREDPPAFGVRRDGTISDIGTGSDTIVVAAHRRSDSRMMRYSSKGFHPTGNTPRDPTASAPADEAPSLFGTVAAATFSGSVARESGTSVSTGFATRIAAQGMPAGVPRTTVQDVATADEGVITHQISPPFPPTPKRSRRGCGRITSIEVPGIPPRREP